MNGDFEMDVVPHPNGTEKWEQRDLNPNQASMSEDGKNQAKFRTGANPFPSFSFHGISKGIGGWGHFNMEVFFRFVRNKRDYFGSPNSPSEFMTRFCGSLDTSRSLTIIR